MKTLKLNKTPETKKIVCCDKADPIINIKNKLIFCPKCNSNLTYLYKKINFEILKNNIKAGLNYKVELKKNWKELKSESEKINKLNQINTRKEEGKLLIAAIATINNLTKNDSENILKDLNKLRNQMDFKY